jgi:hypothetical protein
MRTEQRAHPRHSQRYVVRLHVAEPGAEPKIVRGILLNLSLGGAHVTAEEYIPSGQRCLVELVGAAGRVIPNKAPGIVVEAAPGHGKRIALRIAFEEPLEQIKQPGKL